MAFSSDTSLIIHLKSFSLIFRSITCTAIHGDKSLSVLPLLSRQPRVRAWDSPGRQVLEHVLHGDHSAHAAPVGLDSPGKSGKWALWAGKSGKWAVEGGKSGRCAVGGAKSGVGAVVGCADDDARGPAITVDPVITSPDTVKKIRTALMNTWWQYRNITKEFCNIITNFDWLAKENSQSITWHKYNCHNKQFFIIQSKHRSSTDPVN